MAQVIYRSDLTIPAANGKSVTPDDNTDLLVASRSIYIGNAGNLKVTFIDGNIETFVNLAVGWHPIGVARIWATGTTANNIISVW
jgi:hypothetical protein